MTKTIARWIERLTGLPLTRETAMQAAACTLTKRLAKYNERMIADRGSR